MARGTLVVPAHPTNGMDEIRPLLGTTLILAAHPDDELVMCGGLMQKMQSPFVVFATDGAPRDQGFWQRYGSRQAYANLRREEAQQALALGGATAIFLADRVAGGIADQELFSNVGAAVAAIEAIAIETAPQCILAPGYEGGHPDHDAACFIASIVGRRLDMPVWESPLYHRRADGSSVVQTFPEACGREIELFHEGQCLETKLRMFGCYRSQGSILEGFRPEQETFRQLCGYDFTRPPLPWKLNYEHWGWSMTGNEVAAAFAEYLHAEREAEYAAQKPGEGF